MASEKIVSLTEDNFESEVLQSDKPVLVDFWAEWCGPCRMVAPVLDDIAEQGGDVRIAKLNVDDHQKLAMQYGVQSIPTFILFKGGEAADRMMGAMPKAAFEEFLSERLSRLQELLNREGLAALLVVASSSRDPDLAPFVGEAHLGRSFLVATREGVPKLGYLTSMERDEAAGTGLEPLTPALLDFAGLQRQAGSSDEVWSGLIASGLRQSGLESGTVGLAGRFAAGTIHGACSRLADAGWRFEPAHELLLELRKGKTESELSEIRRAGAAVCEAMRAVAAVLAASEATPRGLRFEGRPLTAGRLRLRIGEILAAHGMEQPEGNIVAVGAAAGVPHTRGASEVALGAGEAVVVDLFPKGRLYADCTRTFCVGEPPAELARAHAAVEQALTDAHLEVEAGAVGADLQGAVCDFFEGEGYPTARAEPATTRGYVHGLGHGVGYDLHEYPAFRPLPGTGGELAAGDVFTLEPGLYDAEAGWGVRLEDLCHLGRDGLEILTPLPYGLDPATWA